MPSIFPSYTLADALVLVLGLILLARGRRLYWLALGGLGFLFGLWLARFFVESMTQGLELGLAFLLGILGAYLAISVQRLAIAVGGFLAGGFGGFWLAGALSHVFRWQNELGFWLVASLGALAGLFLAATLFEASLVLVSSFVGAALVVGRSDFSPPQSSWFFLFLLCLGLLMQTRSDRRAPPKKE